MDLTTFLAIYDEFSKVNSVKVSYALTRANNRIDVEEWGEFTSEAVGLLAAHFLASSGNSPNQLGGIINRINIQNDIEVESTVNYQAKSDLDMTPYGRQFKELKDSVLGNFITCTLLNPVMPSYGHTKQQWLI